MTGRYILLAAAVMTLLACSLGVPGAVMTTPAPTKEPARMVMTVPETTTRKVDTHFNARVTAFRSLNVRVERGHDKPIVGYRWHGDLVVMTGVCDRGWAEIVWESGTAWVNADYLSKNKCSEE